MECCGAGGELLDGFVLAAVRQPEPVVLASPGGGQVRQPGQEEAPLVRRQPGDEVGSGSAKSKCVHDISNISSPLRKHVKEI